MVFHALAFTLFYKMLPEQIKSSIITVFNFTNLLHSTQKIISMRADLSNFIFLDFLYLNIYIYLGTQFYNNVFIQVYTKVVVCFLHVCSLKTRLFICFFLGQLMVE